MIHRLRRLVVPGGWERWAVDRAGVMLGTVEKRDDVAEWWIAIAEDGELLPRARTRDDAVEAVLTYADTRSGIVNAGERQQPETGT